MSVLLVCGVIWLPSSAEISGRLILRRLDNRFMQHVTLTLNAAGVALPAQKAADTAAHVVAAALNSITDEHLAEPWLSGFGISYRFNGPAASIEERRITYESWLLGKGFQDITKGIREMLEEAYVFVSALSWEPRLTTQEELEQDIASLRRRAEKLNLPMLLEEVNRALMTPLTYGTELLSLQRARNCLEHRRGIVGEQDIDPNTLAMTLSFPRLKMYYMRGDQEIEIAPGEVIDTGNEMLEAPILVRQAERLRTYDLGERIILTAADFNEIAMACHMLADDLLQKLPASGRE
ncbi:hypothetical protein [Methylorubrum extorquens]|nr:hypothetical protein [Methylorubrum extorquens]